MVTRIITSRSRLSHCRAYYSTFKSRNDEEKNKSLLENLKSISLTGGKEIVSPPKTETSSDRNVTFETVEKVSRYWHSDPLLWNTSTLSRTFKIPEEYLVNLVWYVRPIIFYAHKGLEEVEKVHKTSLVIDAYKLKYDEKYIARVHKLIFPKRGDELPKLGHQNKVDVIK